MQLSEQEVADRFERLREADAALSKHRESPVVDRADWDESERMLITRVQACSLQVTEAKALALKLPPGWLLEADFVFRREDRTAEIRPVLTNYKSFAALVVTRAEDADAEAAAERVAQDLWEQWNR